MSGVLAIALAQMALSHGTVPNAVPVGQAFASGTSGTLWTVGTSGTDGTISGTFLDREAVDVGAIEERVALAADSVPALFLDAWARLQCQRPSTVNENAWRRAIIDAGLFLDAWGEQAAEMGWTAGELFDVPRDGKLGGLIWFIEGERIGTFGAEQARTDDGRTIARSAIRGAA